MIYITSGKNLSRADITNAISKIGNPVIIVTDRNPVPRTIEKIAAGFFAKLVYPKNSLTRKEKFHMAKEYMKIHGRVWSNSHEKDALVAAIYAWKQIRPVVDKIKIRLRKQGIHEKDVISYVERYVILYKKSISSAIKDYNEKAKIIENSNR